MDRRLLDELAAHHGLAVASVAEMLELAGARPGRAELQHFVVRVLRLAGVLSLAAGVVFFVAANWSALSVLGRFGLVQAVLLGATGVALWRPPPQALGRYALLLAFIVTGALFALYGQTYQTGADVYELFLNWALLGVFFVAAARWSVTWAAWVLVLNVALWLYCGARPEAGAFWLLFSPWGLSTSQLLLVPLLVNVGLWATVESPVGTRLRAVVPRWLGRFALAWGVASGTWGGLIVVFRGGGDEGVAGLVLPLLIFAAVGLFTLRRRADVFPLAAIEGSLIVLSTAWITQIWDGDETLLFFVLAGWLILTSTVCGRYLMRLVRAWDTAEQNA